MTERKATRSDLMRLLREAHRELIETLGLGLVSLSVPLSGEPVLVVRLLPGREPPEELTEIRVRSHEEALLVPVHVVSAPPIRAIRAGEPKTGTG